MLDTSLGKPAASALLAMSWRWTTAAAGEAADERVCGLSRLAARCLEVGLDDRFTAFLEHLP